jgi:hypothetical protein
VSITGTDQAARIMELTDELARRDAQLKESVDHEVEYERRIAQLEAALREAIAQMESDAVFHDYDRGYRSISELPDNDLPDALLHARAALAPKEPT